MAIACKLINSDQSLYSDADFSAFQTLIATSGVFNANGNNTDLQVGQHDGGNMTVDIASGNGLFGFTKAGVTWNVIFTNNATANIAIAANSSGSNRVDAIVAHVKQTMPNLLKNNVGEFIAVLGSGVSALTDAAVTASVGDTNWYRLANVTVANGATQILTAAIADMRAYLSLGQFFNVNSQNVTTDMINAGGAGLGVQFNSGDQSFRDQRLQMVQRTTVAATPSTNYWKMYFKSGGLYTLDSFGNESLLSALSNSPRVFGGTGADGALSISSGTTNINCAGEAFVVRNYTSISITGTASVVFTNPNVNGTIIQLRSKGDVTLTSSNVCIDASGMGGAGGAGGAGTYSSPATAGGAGKTGYMIADSVSHNGIGGISGAGGGGGTGLVNVFLYTTDLAGVARRSLVVSCGSGGGGGQGASEGAFTGPNGGAGGAGGGGLLIECGGAWNFTSANGISVAGKDGAAGGNIVAGGWNIFSAGGGGGGSGGFCVALYNSLVSSTGTINTAGGNGGSSGSAQNTSSAGSGGNSAAGGGGGGGGGGDGGAGGAGSNVGGAGSSAAGQRAGGGGGGGVDQSYNIVGTVSGKNGGVGGASANVLIAQNLYYV